MNKPRVAVHKFTSCDGCQLAFLNAGENLLTLADMVDIVHFAEAGPIAPDAKVDIAFVEGSISTPEEEERICKVRENTAYLITIGACATAGGIQALRNMHDTLNWIQGVYAKPEYISSLETSSPIKDHVCVDFELWGCPVTTQQVLTAVRSLMYGVTPRDEVEKVCMECKRREKVCVMVTRNEPCLGPVTRTGCGAICPSFGRDCYGCFGPAENVNITGYGNRLAGFGLTNVEISRRFQFFNNNAPEFKLAIETFKS